VCEVERNILADI